MSTVELPFAAGSNLVFSADGERLFLRSASGELWSATTPRAQGDSPPPLECHDEYAAEGMAVAAGWLEGRLAVLGVRGDVLFASHGLSGVNFEPSSALRVPIAGSGLALARTNRLDPYLRWPGETNPMEELPMALTLVRSDDDRLCALLGWPLGGGQEAQFDLLAEEVSALAALDGSAMAKILVVGRPAMRPAPRRLRPGARRNPPAVIELSRRFVGWEPGIVRSLEGDRPPRALPGYPGARFLGTFGLLARERSTGAWAAWRGHDEPAPDIVFHIATGDEVVGVVDDGTGQDRTLLVVRDSERRSLSLLDEHGHKRVVIAEHRPIEQVTFSLVDPVVAYVSGGRLCFARLVGSSGVPRHPIGGLDGTF
jgi:hypothetical protein